MILFYTKKTNRNYIGFCKVIFLVIVLLPLFQLNGAPEDALDGPAMVSTGTEFSFVIDSSSASDEVARKNFKDNSIFANPIEINHWEISKFKNIIAIVITNPSGQKGQIWIDGSCKLVRPPEGTGFYVDEDPPDRDRFNIDFGKYGYCHGSWVSADNYVGKVKFNGLEALYFCEPKPPKVASSKLVKPPIREAWVDLKNRFPIYIKENGSIYSYKILPPPSSLQLPIEAKNYLARRAEALKPFTTGINRHP